MNPIFSCYFNVSGTIIQFIVICDLSFNIIIGKHFEFKIKCRRKLNSIKKKTFKVIMSFEGLFMISSHSFHVLTPEAYLFFAL
jgi:hypothetical protein